MARDFATELVMTAAAKYRVHASSASTHRTPIAGVHVTDFTFADQEAAETFTAGCMGDGVPARYCGLIDGENTVVVLH